MHNRVQRFSHFLISVFIMHLSVHQYFWRSFFNPRFKIDIVVMII